MALREYQQTAVEDTYKSLRQHKSTMLQMPTGSGKTHVAMEIIRNGLQNGRRINFCVDRLTLIDQTLDRFWSAGIETGVVQGDHPLYKPSAPVQLVSLQTLARRPQHRWPEADLFIIDEAHDQYNITYDVMERWDALKYIGLSATPFTTGLGRHWQDLVVATTTAELIEAGYLSKYQAYGPSSPNMAGARIYGSDWANEDAMQRMNPLTGDIVTHYTSMAAGQKAIVFAVNVNHAKALATAFCRAGIAADYVTGRDSEERRKRVLSEYAQGDITVLTNCAVLTKGYDQPDIEVGIMARPTRSLALHIQMCGRVLRATEGKDKALILDHAGNIERLGFPDDPLPMRMSMKEKGVSEVDRRNEEPEPWNCPGCHHLNPPRTPQCEACGVRPQVENAPDAVPGVLKILSKEGRADKQTVHAMLKTIARERSYKDGWVSNAYKDLFGVWPKNINRDLHMRATFEMRSWVNERIANNRKHYYARGGR